MNRAKQDAIFFGAVLSRIPTKASKATIKVNGINDCIGKTIKIIGFNTATCKIEGIYGNKPRQAFKMRTARGIRHNLMVNSVYHKNTLRTEINAII